uniref:helix-turn-helix domain-containing protein n=1 Tax=Enterocloster clostridioformis TaxID=1531 RepID=UPI002670634A|nr:helix-turn-helix domain-containing protein [Enterocloster clostridioformis]
MPKYYTCEEIAERYRVKTATVWGWIRNGRLSAIRIGGLYRVAESAMAKFEGREGKEDE